MRRGACAKPTPRSERGGKIRTRRRSPETRTRRPGKSETRARRGGPPPDLEPRARKGAATSRRSRPRCGSRRRNARRRTVGGYVPLWRPNKSAAPARHLAIFPARGPNPGRYKKTPDAPEKIPYQRFSDASDGGRESEIAPNSRARMSLMLCRNDGRPSARTTEEASDARRALIPFQIDVRPRPARGAQSNPPPIDEPFPVFT